MGTSRVLWLVKKNIVEVSLTLWVHDLNASMVLYAHYFLCYRVQGRRIFAIKNEMRARKSGSARWIFSGVCLHQL